MKNNFTKLQNYKLFKYNLLKLQIYSGQFQKTTLLNSNYVLEQIEAYFKQALKIIFEYHKSQLKILFVGFPIVSKLKQKKLIHFTNHNFISQKSWINGLLRNRFSILHYLTALQSQNFSKKLNLLVTLKMKPHLVVIFNSEVETNIIDEFYKTKIPILSFNCDFLNTWKITYRIPGNYDFIKKNIKVTYFFLLYSILKKKVKKTNIKHKRNELIFKNKIKKTSGRKNRK